MATTGKGRILVVDDDRLVLATLAHGLSQAGYQVIDADNGNDAILLAREHRPDLALLDIRMEGMSGFDVAETLRGPIFEEKVVVRMRSLRHLSQSGQCASCGLPARRGGGDLRLTPKGANRRARASLHVNLA